MKRPPVLFLLALAFQRTRARRAVGHEDPFGRSRRVGLGTDSARPGRIVGRDLGGFVCLIAGALYCGLVRMGSQANRQCGSFRHKFLANVSSHRGGVWLADSRPIESARGVWIIEIRLGALLPRTFGIFR